jgi:hypothetical protein
MDWKKFEQAAKIWLEKKEGLTLEKGALPLGAGKEKKDHSFDWIDHKRKVLVECKTGTWRKGGGVPNGKMTNWNEAMYLFYLAPAAWRKIFIVCRDKNPKTGQTLLQYYWKDNSHLVPPGTKILDYDPASGKCNALR